MVALNYDPIALGYIASLARPGGNITGVFFRLPEITAKQLELFRNALPRGAPVTVLWEPAAADQMRSAIAAGTTLGMSLQSVEVRPPYDFDVAFAQMIRSRAAGVLVVGGPLFFRERGRIAALALKHRLPSMSSVFPDLRYTMGYGPSLSEALRRAADYADRILKGAKPADLPVEQPTKFEVVINLKTAKAIGLTIPPSLLGRADEVIQ
jgi:putative tryptophan/tyrosine transport system substrate-binding protein